VKVYVVLAGDEPFGQEWIEGVFATRALAEAHLGLEVERARPEWQKLVDKAGSPIPRQGYKDGRGGIIPQRHEHPGDFNRYLMLGAGRRIEEWEVVES
jgi:hypothetical protein